MKRFSTTCIDNKTGMEMVLCEASYNSACVFLEIENRDKRFGRFLGIEARPLQMAKIKFQKATFFYDEERGYLLRKE